MSIPVFKAMVATGCGLIGAALLVFADAVPNGSTIGQALKCGTVGFAVMSCGSWVCTSIVLGIATHKELADATVEQPRVGNIGENTSAVTIQFLPDRRRNGGPIEAIAERVGVWRGPK